MKQKKEGEFSLTKQLNHLIDIHEIGESRLEHHYRSIRLG